VPLCMFFAALANVQLNLNIKVFSSFIHGKDRKERIWLFKKIVTSSFTKFLASNPTFDYIASTKQTLRDFISSNKGNVL